MAEQLESKTAIMLDQAQVDAAEAVADAQENGENGEHIGRRPSSSGRDSKRHRKSSCSAAVALFFSLSFCPSTAERGYLQQTLLLYPSIFTTTSAFLPIHSPFLPSLHFFLLRNQLGCNKTHSNPTQHMRQTTPPAVTFQQGLCNG
jgi:hypothetical protein